IPTDVPGKGKIKAVVTGTIGATGPGDQPSRRCKQGKVVGRGRGALEPGGDTSLLLSLTKAGARCLAGDGDGDLPLDVTVQVRRKKTPLAEVTATRTWRR